jgi:DNA-binding response OmpR family regulator
VARILIVEDHESIREGVAAYLRQDGHEVTTRPDGSDLIALAPSFDLFVLDVMLPGRDGFALARDLRSLTSAPFLFLTARSDETDRIAGWEAGASDYVAKPFSPKELVYRVRSLLGRVGSRSGVPTFEGGGHRLEVDSAAHRLAIDGQPVELTPGEWSFLGTLVARPGVVLSRKDLMSAALLYYVDTGERTVDTHIKNLRAKLGDHPWIETVRGFGYRFGGSPGPVR